MADTDLTYVIPDIHGRADLLKLGVARIRNHLGRRRGKIITLGDYVDRGPRSADVLEMLLNWPAHFPPLVTLKGNHEAMMLAACRGEVKLEWWLQNGGSQTLRSYGLETDDPADLRHLPAAHLEFISRLPLMHVDRHRVFVHAGVDPEKSLEQHSERILLWKRYPPFFEKGHGERHVVHGHDADPSGPIATSGRTNLDCMAWRTGRLAIGIFQDAQRGGACEFLDVVGPE